MGQKASCAFSTPASPQGILLLHINGDVGEFLEPVKVKQVLSEHQSRSFIVCRWSDLQLHLHAIKPLTMEEELRKGETYLVLPISALHSDVSPTNLVAVGKKLLVAAKRQASKQSCTVRKAPKSDKGCSGSYCNLYAKMVESCENREVETAYGEHLQMLAQTRSWKPSLHTIHETSHDH